MIRKIAPAFLIFLEPAFIEAKAVLAGFLIARPHLDALATVAVGFLFCLGLLSIFTLYEGTKALFEIRRILAGLPAFSLKRVEVISPDRFASEFGYSHMRLKFGPFGQDAGEVTLLYDTSGTLTDYQCAYNTFGMSYILLPSDRKLEDMSLYQRYLTLHEIGHGSFAGGGIWTRAWLIASSAIFAIGFGLLTTNFSTVGLVAIGLTAICALLSARGVVIESEAEVFADDYAIGYIARGNESDALRIIRKLIDGIEDVYPSLETSDRLINKSRLKFLRSTLRNLSLGKTTWGARPSIKWMHYLAAALLLWWTATAPKAESHVGWLLLAFAILFAICVAVRVKQLPIMFRLDKQIRSRIGS
ncbi:Hypothetical protein NGAL_HAMBI1145_32710 [Neorhizobium galegae bv. officinalis]|uniref:Uncharacterized protein n=1 Tax=Neorhizobium galegae bv. officinalis TaxID=323656 RepID=A0A0T7FMP3_NEOGA|nr:hypothetical protein [Neorhizobium galegae]CDZ36254.1 Hypothetical protein NGAL_HAMBI1145_32710 [Neorhizobium galegae bv. officinalis]